MKKTYFVHTDSSYAGALPSTLVRVEATWLELLRDLNQIEEDDLDEVWEQDGVKRTCRDLTEKELVDLFNNANGDGANYITAFEAMPDGSFKLVLG